MIKRDFYLNQIIDRMWDGRIKVITGIRRCGKSILHNKNRGENSKRFFASPRGMARINAHKSPSSIINI